MKKNVSRKSGFTLVEILIVVVIMAILAATVVPQFSNSTGDAKTGTARFNLNTLRSQIELYKSQHNGAMPTQAMTELISSTNNTGTIGTGANFPYGPYIQTIPMNPYTNSNTVVAAGANPPTATVSGAGWLFDLTSGKIWINDTTTPFANQ
ncbi:MAG: prepilin-type N-terminal cleavage/methylation domain-containing protein [Planctomycetes bacterium]|nr:prepilin-type N-terminal cleavage/methylation domain-containing protein [Planctomycetota bacterium]